MKELPIYDRVLVIGNGFDLNLGLKTSYTDFMSSKMFKNLLADNNELANHLEQNKNIKNWIDIELELKYYSLKWEGRQSNFFKEFKSLSESLKQYLLTQKSSKINKNSDAYSFLEENAKTNNVLILDFNYTDTVHTILEDLNLISYIKHIKIHGDLKSDKIIFGVEDNSEIYPRDTFLLKSLNDNYLNIRNLDEVLIYCKTFLVFGHSLGETDHQYFKEMFQMGSNKYGNHLNKNIFIYYYKDESKNEISAEIYSMTSQNIKDLKRYNNFKMIDVTKKDSSTEKN